MRAALHPNVAKYDEPPSGCHSRDMSVRYSATNADIAAISARHHRIYLNQLKLRRCLRTLVTGMRDAHSTPSAIHITISRLNVFLPTFMSSISTIHPGLYISTKNSRNAGIISIWASNEGMLSSFLGITVIFFVVGRNSFLPLFVPVFTI